MIIIPRNWAEFQHYKKRSPPWIRLHRKLLDDYDFQRLPLASKALAPMLWLLASESKDTERPEIDADPDRLAFRLRITKTEAIESLIPLIDAGFFEIASGVLAECMQLAAKTISETEADNSEAETKGEAQPSVPPTPEKKAPSRKRNGELTFKEWVAASIDAAGAEEFVPLQDSDPIHAWALQTKIPERWIDYAWEAFDQKYSPQDKRYKDWMQVFRRAVREDWLKVWRTTPEGAVLTTVGEQIRNSLDG